MKTSKQARRGAKQLYRSCLVEGRLQEDRVRQAVQQLLVLKPRGYFPLLAHFHRLVKLEVERRSARVESAVPLETDLRARLGADLERHCGPGLEVSFVENPGLLGGLRIRVGSDVYDGSVQGRLAALRELA